MIHFDYNCWKETVIGIFKAYTKSPYIQLIPFIKLSENDKVFIASEDFFNKWIKTGAFTYYSDTWNISNAYILKNNGTYRKATNISPIFFLFISAFTKYISKFYFTDYGDRKIQSFYAGDISLNRFDYKKDYDNYCKEINNQSQSYTHFIKLDIGNFFTNININKLFSLIDTNINSENTNICSRDLLYIKELLKCLGNGNFPIIRNLTALSFLTTKIYLKEFDVCLYDYIYELAEISNFEFIRYVDDLYILVNVDSTVDFEYLVKSIINKANSELLKLDLQLNIDKVKYDICPCISDTLWNSLYDDMINDIKFSVDDYYSDSKLLDFIDKLNILSQQETLNIKKYNDLIINFFSIDGLTKSANEVFNAFLYTESNILQQSNVIKKLNQVIKNDNLFIKLDPDRLTLFVLNTKNEKLIKNMLNRLFDNDRNNKFDVYDLHIALIYIVQKGFMHSDLLRLIKKYDVDIYNYINSFCKKNFINTYTNTKSLKNKFINNIFHKKDKGKLYYLYSFYKIKSLERNYLEAFAYYKNYFDRMTAHFDAYINKQQCLNINGFYRKKDLQRFYENYNEVIEKAHDIRNSNPLSHASAELLDNNESESCLQDIHKNLSDILKEKIESIIIHPMSH